MRSFLDREALVLAAGFVLLVTSACSYRTPFPGEVEPSPAFDGRPGPDLFPVMPLKVTDISAGGNSTCAIAEGDVYCWGDNDRGQLGDGTLIDRNVPVRVEGLPGPAERVFAQGATSCALVNGAAWCWGANYNGVIGDGTRDHTIVPVPVTDMDANVTDIAIAQFGGCGVKSGQAFCWGEDANGILGNGSGTNADQLTAGPVAAPLDSGVMDLDMGQWHACASRDSDADARADQVWCWGWDGFNALGNDALEANQSAPAQVAGLPPGEIVAVELFGFSSCARIDANDPRDGVADTAYCWGDKSYNAAPSPGDYATPTAVQGLSSVESITGFSSYSFATYSCAVDDGAVKCWGADTFGQLGDGEPAPGFCTFAGNSNIACSIEATPVSLPSGRATKVVGGINHVCALLDEQAYCWGHDGFGQLGNGGQESVVAPTRPVGLTGEVSLMNGGGIGDMETSCGVMDGAAYCWGSNQNLGLGDGTALSSTSPVAVTNMGSGVTAIDIGRNHVCGIKDSAAWCWGTSWDIHLGAVSAASSAVPVPVQGIDGTSGRRARLLSVGFQHTCAAVDTVGSALADEVRCWGRGTSGELGNGASVSSRAPVTVLGLTGNITALAAGGDFPSTDGPAHGCAVIAGQVFCWGGNPSGELGLGNSVSTDRATTPVLGLPGPAIELAIGSSFTCATVDTDADAVADQVHCWGNGASGSLGSGDFDNRRLAGVPALLPAGRIGHISAHYRHVCATLDPDGGSPLEATEIYCWGSNEMGQLGLADRVDIATPQRVPHTEEQAVFTSISAASQHTCASLSGGGALCWGRDTYGQLGLGSKLRHTGPQRPLLPTKR